MAIKERKQITGTEAQIKGYAGHNGVLAYATDTKHLHVLSGTAGTTTKLANMSDIPAPVDISDKADKTYVDTELAKKQTKGDYATNTALTQGLAGKANSSHTHTKSQITDFPTIPDAILKKGNRGAIAGYEQWTKVGATTTLNVSSGDSLLMETAGVAATINVQVGSIGQVATKFVWVSNSNKSITINGNVGWFGGNAPTLNKSTVLLLFLFHDLYTECMLIGQWG
jgi:hypothetical protein|nr:MAG TPA: tail repeat-like protein [Caudoviricetes sp.]